VDRGFIVLAGADSGTLCDIGAVSKEAADAGTTAPRSGFAYRGYNSIYTSGWIELGPSRNLRVYGQNNDDNSLDMSVKGWTIQR
jgi:hypothetical protein